jgi:uncharacterized DUF497 family protein
VRFSWNEAKSTANFRERGFDFAFASSILDGPTLSGRTRARTMVSDAS